MALSFVPKGALNGELDVWWADFRGDCLLGPALGGLKMIFFLEAAFFNGRRGDNFFGFGFCADGIGARSKDVSGS